MSREKGRDETELRGQESTERGWLQGKYSGTEREEPVSPDTGGKREKKRRRRKKKKYQRSET